MGSLLWIGIGFILGNEEMRDQTISTLKKATRIIDEKINESIGYTKPSKSDTELRSTEQRQVVKKVD